MNVICTKSVISQLDVSCLKFNNLIAVNSTLFIKTCFPNFFLASTVKNRKLELFYYRQKELENLELVSTEISKEVWIQS